jgi:hypothetical protein
MPMTTRLRARGTTTSYSPARSTRSLVIAMSLACGAAGALAAAPPAAAAIVDSVDSSYDRAPLREYPGRLVLANALPGDRIELTGRCGEWIRVRVLDTRHVMATTVGWMLRSSLSQAKRDAVFAQLPSACDRRDADSDRWRDWVRAMNAPFRSLRRTTHDGNTGWWRVQEGTNVALLNTDSCVPSLNYTRNPSAADSVDPAQRVNGLNLSRVRYRYVTMDRSVALVAAPRLGQEDRPWVWAFVQSHCVRPAPGRAHVYFDEPVVQVHSLGRLGDVAQGHNDIEPYTNRTVHDAGCSAAVRIDEQFGYWPDPLPANRPACPV